MKKVKVIVARPGEDAFVMEIIPDYKHLAALVGGHIEHTFPISDDVAIFCDECGKLKSRLGFAKVNEKTKKQRYEDTKIR